MSAILRSAVGGGGNFPVTAARRQGDALGLSVQERLAQDARNAPRSGDQLDLFGGPPTRAGAGAGAVDDLDDLGGTGGASTNVDPRQLSLDLSGTAPRGPSHDQLFNFRGTDPGWFGSQWMQDGGMRGAIGGAAIGMAASYVTGGELGQGALMGAAGGALGRGIHTHLKANSASLHNAAVGYTGFGSSATQWMLKNPNSINTIQRRTAAMAGAGLMGVVGGGNRKNNHRRGMNAHRGNHF